jgi:hypothetical protein
MRLAVLVLVLLGLMAGCHRATTKAQPPVGSTAWKKAQEDAIYEAAFQYRFGHDKELNHKRPYYLIILDPTERWRDPSDAVMKRLSSTGFNVRKGAAMANAHNDAQYVWFNRIDWTDDSQAVAWWAGSYGRGSIFWMGCEVIRQDDCWTGRTIIRGLTS